MTDYDSPWKEALDFYFQLFIAFFYPQIYPDIDWARGYETLDKELQQIVREAELGRRVVDKLVKVWRKDGSETWILIHVEIQSQYEVNFAKRMYVYDYRLVDRYDREVVSLAVLGDEDPNWRPNHYESGIWGSRRSFTFEIVKLLDYTKHEAELECDLNPFATLVLAPLKTQQTRRTPETRRAWKMRLARGLYERGLGPVEVRQLFRLVDWIMDLPPEQELQFRDELYRYEEEKRMPYVTSIERLAAEKGRTEGRAEALLLGIELALELKFGAAGLQLLSEIRQIADVEKLQAIHQAIKSAGTLEQLRQLWACD